MVTSREVAKAAGVSQATVSRVLSESSLVSSETRERVTAAMKQVGYVPNRSARAMRTGRTGTIGVVVADLANPFYPELVEALSKVLDEHGLRLAVWVSDGGKNRSALEAIAEQAVDGVVFTTVGEDSPELRTAIERNSAFVLVNRTLPSISCDQVSSANETGSALATSHLIERGSSRLAFVGGTSTSTTTMERRAGFEEAVAAAGLEPVSITTGEYTHASGRQRARELLSLDDRPDAFVCSNDLLAFGVLDAARDLGLDVPTDLRIVGYDDVTMAQWPAFDLTTVRQDTDELARRAVGLLLRRFESPVCAPQHVRIEPVLAVRGSTS